MDDYMVMAAFRDQGLPLLPTRILTWSPRPLSESMLFIYATLVARVGRPLIGWLLVPLWVAFLATALVTVRWRSPGLVWRLLAGLALLAMFIVARDPGEVFYWPAGAVAYLTSLVGLSLAFFIVADGRNTTPTGRLCLTISLIVAAWSSEIGAIFGACYAALGLINGIAGRFRRNDKTIRWAIQPAIVLVMSLAVLLLMMTHRGSMVGELAGGSDSVMHRPLPTLMAAVRGLPLDLLTESGQTEWPGVTWSDITHGFLIRFAFAIGFGWCWRYADSARGSRAGLLLFALACLATTFLALIASDYQFGRACCSRHSAFREEVFFLGVAALAAGISPSRRSSFRYQTTPVLGGVLLVAAVLVPFSAMVPGLKHDYAQRATVVAQTKATWDSGQAPGSAMVFHRRPDQAVLPNGELDPGQYELNADTHWFAVGILKFFKKQTLTVVSP